MPGALQGKKQKKDPLAAGVTSRMIVGSEMALVPKVKVERAQGKARRATLSLRLVKVMALSQLALTGHGGVYKGIKAVTTLGLVVAEIGLQRPKTSLLFFVLHSFGGTLRHS